MKLHLVLLAAAIVLPGADNEFLRWDAKRANSIAAARRANGEVGKNLDFRIIRTDRSINYKLRATWLTPEVIRACARLEQIKDSLSDQETLKLVADAERVGDTVILVEIDPREGSGVIPAHWTAMLSPRSASSVSPRGARGTSLPRLREFPALAGYGRRDYAYDIFWVVFPLRAETGEQIFGAEDREAELTVRIYDKVGKVRWPIPESIRERAGQLSRAQPPTLQPPQLDVPPPQVRAIRAQPEVPPAQRLGVVRAQQFLAVH